MDIEKLKNAAELACVNLESTASLLDAHGQYSVAHVCRKDAKRLRDAISEHLQALRPSSGSESRLGGSGTST